MPCREPGSNWKSKLFSAKQDFTIIDIIIIIIIIIIIVITIVIIINIIIIIIMVIIIIITVDLFWLQFPPNI